MYSEYPLLPANFRKMHNYAKPIAMKRKFKSAYPEKPTQGGIELFLASTTNPLSRQQHDLKAKIFKKIFESNSLIFLCFILT